MDSEGLKDYLETKMHMSHIYQPLIIRKVIEADGRTTIPEVAQQLAYIGKLKINEYKQKLKSNPIPRLEDRGIIKSNGEEIILLVNINTAEKLEIISICNRKMGQFLHKKGQKMAEYLSVID